MAGSLNNTKLYTFPVLNDLCNKMINKEMSDMLQKSGCQIIYPVWQSI